MINLKRRNRSSTENTFTAQSYKGSLITKIKAQHNDPFNHYILIFGLGMLFVVLQFAESEMLKTYLWFPHNSFQSLFGSLVAVFLCYLILNTSLHKHNKVALVIMFFIGIYLGYIYFVSLLNWETQNWPTVIICFLLIFCDPLREVYEKYMMEMHLMNTFSLMIAEGLIGTIVSVAFLLVAVFTDISLDIFILTDTSGNPMAKFTLTWENCYIFVAFAGCAFLANHLRLKSNELFHPIQRYSFVSLPYLLISLGCGVCYFIFKSLPDDTRMNLETIFFLYFGRRFSQVDIGEISWRIAGDVVIAICWLICATLMNEVIIFYICGLHLETKMFIGDRGESEMKLASKELINEKEDYDL